MKSALIAALILSMGVIALPQTGGPDQRAGRRLALVIGNQNYLKLRPLAAAPKEVELVRNALVAANFQVTSVMNAGYDDLTKAVSSFVAGVKPGDICFFYYSGYAAQDAEDDLLIPTDFDPAKDSLDSNTAYPLTVPAKYFTLKGASLKMFFVEGARKIDVRISNARPGLRVPDVRGLGEVLMAIPAASETFVETPSDQVGLFTNALVQTMNREGLPLSSLMPQVQKAVLEQGKGPQPNYVSTVLPPEFYFHAPRKETAGPSRVQNRIDREFYVWIPPGKFWMGCVPSDAKCDNNEKPRHAVTITKGFWMGENEVQVDSYRKFVDVHRTERQKMPPANLESRNWRDGALPINNMTWEDARNYCSWAGGRLPTEAEWEYAARGGKDKVYPFDDPEESRDKANFHGKQGNDVYEYTAPVKKFDVNSFGLYDMSGNVWELVNDFLGPYPDSPVIDPKGPETGKVHVQRGGSFDSDARHLRISIRRPAGTWSNVGFRCVLNSLPQPPQQPQQEQKLTPADQVETLVTSGLLNLQQGKWDAAAANFNAALAIRFDPRASSGLAIINVHTTYDVGLKAFGQEDFLTASDMFSRVLKLQPTFKDKPTIESLAPLFADAQVKSKVCGAELQYRAGVEQFNRGDYASARNIFLEILRNDSNNQRAMDQLVKLSQVDAAERPSASRQAGPPLPNLPPISRQKSIDQEQDPARTAERERLIQSGLAHLQQSKWEAAAADFKAVLAHQPDVRASRGLSIATVHTAYETAANAFHKREFDSASDKFSEVLKLQPVFKDKPTIDSLAPLFTDAKVKAKQSENELLLRTGIDLFNRGEYPRARAVFEQALNNGLNNRQVIEQMDKLERVDEIALLVTNGQKRLEAHDWAGAQRDFESALVFNRYDVRALAGQHQAIDALHTQQRNATLAGAGIGIPAIAFIVVMAPATRRARVYARLGRTGKAASLLQRILEKNPTRSDILVRLFHLYTGTGKRDQAIQAAMHYLQLRPDDAGVLTLLGDAYLERREFELARHQFQHLLAIDPGNPIACSRLLASEDQSADSISSVDVSVCEKALVAKPESFCLNCLVSRYYVREDRMDKQALQVYRRAISVEPANRWLRICCARACWAQGDFAEAGRHAREVLRHDPDNRPMLLLFLRANAKCGSLANAFEIVDSGGMGGLQVISVCEEIAEIDPAQRDAVHRRYEQLSKKDAGSTAQLLSVAHLAIDDASAEASVESVTAAAALDCADADSRREIARVLARFLNANRAVEGYPQHFANLFFRLAELRRQLAEPRAALAALQTISRLPEWLVRCVQAMDEILENLGAHELAAIFFQEVGWRASLVSGPNHDDLLLNPPDDGESTLFSFFENAKARCFDRAITLDDVVRLKGDLNSQEVFNREFAFVVSPMRPRQDVLALIYALLTDEPSLRVIPLEGLALKQAIIDGKSPEVLDQLLRLWVGQADLYDVHNPIADASTFFGRGHFIHAITTKIIQGENFGLFGLRKVGKTSLVFQLRENLAKNLIGYADLQSVASHRCDEIYFRLSAALRRELRIKFPEAPPISSRLAEFDARESYPSIASDFHSELLQIKAAIEACGQQPRILLLLDEIELLLPQGQNRGFTGYEDFFRQIRGLYQQEQFVLSGVIGADPSACRAGKWGDRDNPVFQYYDEIFLTPLDRPECDQMVRAIGEVMGISFDQAGLARIFNESGGHPYVARQLCSRIVTRYGQRPLAVTEDMVGEGVDDYIAQRPDYFIGVFRGYISGEARQILQVAAASEEESVSRETLLAFAAKSGLDRVAFDRALQDLELFHLTVRAKDRYHIKIQLLRRWIRRSWLGIE
jgi:formylglycine-generating enzyme required for sulfatase activity/tetratricopeptide (TPR) repeat protein